MRSGMAAKISPHSVNQRPVFCQKFLDSSSSPREQASLLRVQEAGRSTLQVPSDQSASNDLTDVSTAQRKTTTKITDKTSSTAESGLSQVGCFSTSFLNKAFLTSSLKLVSHFCRRIFLETQPMDFLKTFQ